MIVLAAACVLFLLLSNLVVDIFLLMSRLGAETRSVVEIWVVGGAAPNFPFGVARLAFLVKIMIE